MASQESVRANESNQISEEDFTCGICYEILVNPTTLTCGHSVCRHCLAQWWIRSHQANCPICRHVWSGFPKVNVTLRNAIESMFTERVQLRRQALLENRDHQEALAKFEAASLSEQAPIRARNLTWTRLGILLSSLIAIAVVTVVSYRNFTGNALKSLYEKPLQNWSPDDVAVWVAELGPWVKLNGFDRTFKEAGIDGSLLSKMTSEDLEGPPFNMKLKVQRSTVLESLVYLTKTVKKVPTEFWEYKESHSGMAIFILFGLREYPRATIAFLYLFHYESTFLPFFYRSAGVYETERMSIDARIEQSRAPSLEEWKWFVPQWFFVPYYLCVKFAVWHLTVNYWTSRIGILHAILMTMVEISKIGFLFGRRLRVRQLPGLAFRSSVMVVLLSLVFKLLWPFVPSFIGDCVFYWMIFISPFDAINRLRQRFGNGLRQNAVGREDIRDAGWRFNFQWNAGVQHVH